jgi:hypothetical protein
MVPSIMLDITVDPSTGLMKIGMEARDSSSARNGIFLSILFCQTMHEWG